MRVISVATGEVKASGQNTVLVSSGIGSCIVIGVYEKKLRIGALAHVMLPGRSPKNEKNLRYCHDAFEAILKKLELLGAEEKNFSACLVGGGNVLKKADDLICEANIKSCLDTINSYHVPIMAHSLGGTERRSVTFNLSMGHFYCAVGDGPEFLLCDFLSQEDMYG